MTVFCQNYVELENVINVVVWYADIVVENFGSQFIRGPVYEN